MNVLAMTSIRMVFWVSVIGCVYLLYFPTIAVIKGTSFNATVRSNMVDNTVRFISLRRSSVSFDGFCHYCIRLPGFIKRIRRPITNAPLLTFDAMMSKDIKSKPAPSSQRISSTVSRVFGFSLI